MKRIYIAGPMTGLPDSNAPAFHAAALTLRAKGFHVENPAENAAPDCGSWEGWMRLAIAQLITCDYLVLLPGWDSSRGAKIECDLAGNLNMAVMGLALAQNLIPDLSAIRQEQTP